MEKTIAKKRDVAVDFVKVIATLLVMNSHMGICYGNYSILATGGGIGDTLFFFVSGFTLFMGRKLDFVNWYKRRIGRIYPTILAVAIVSCFILGNTDSFKEVIIAERYWFLQCILVCYLLLYPVIKYEWKLTICIPFSILFMIVIYFTCYDFGNKLFYGQNSYFRWILYFTIMLIGGYIYSIHDSLRYKWYSIPAFLLSIITWYVINYATKGTDWTILSYFPLIGICFFAYTTGKAAWIKTIFSTKIFGNLLFIIGNLCLESYLIQKFIFTDALNGIFPYNIPIIMLNVLIAAYILHIFSGIISQILDSKQFECKSLFLYKRDQYK